MTKLNIEKVKTLREQHGFSQEYVSGFLGYTAKGAYNQLEKGKKQPSVSRLGLLAKLYGVKVDDLLVG
ncbi:helix-turn-helix domain-containing protein [Bacillus sp. AFS075034]|uniref:helix-turn-helix domain-containing protein n=1 Tax=Bacillus sp. AFS075034 TaxID=2034281 RepID=UPI000BF75B7C|nr:helix-turn-helix transcriptional regulator [Bacillus sp. AFS075034]PFW58572.1 transcriptional regulator [Bacillus sp. AFS075034]